VVATFVTTYKGSTLTWEREKEEKIRRKRRINKGNTVQKC